MSEEWRDQRREVSRDAQALRDRLRAAQKMRPAEKREARAHIMREALELLQQSGTPHPLWALIADLFGKIKIDPETDEARGDWSSFADRPPGRVVYERDGVVVTDDAFLRVAKMEARSDGHIPLKELSRRLNRELSERHGELHTETDYTKQIRTWRKRDDYKALLTRLTPHPLDR